MGLIANIASIALTVLAAVVARLMAEDFKEWTPRIVERLIDQAVRGLPDQQSRERYSEEWRSDVADIPGTLGKLWFAAGCLTASRSIAREARGEAAWITAILDAIAFRGASIVQRPFLRALRKELLKQCDPVLCDKAVCEVERRFEPILRQSLRSRLRQFGGYHATADAIRQEFANVIWNYCRELQDQAKRASSNPTGQTVP